MNQPISQEKDFILRDCVVVFVIALVFRLVFGLLETEMTIDEKDFVQPTIERFLAGDFPIFLHNSTYMGTIEPFLGSLIYRMTENWHLSLKLPIITLDALGVALLCFILRLEFSRRVSLCIALLLSAPNSAIFEVIANNHPGYGIGRIVTALTVLGCIWVKRNPTLVNHFLFAVGAGVSAYLFPQNIVQYAACALWLLLNEPELNPSWLRLKECLADSERRFRSLVIGSFLFVGAAALLALVYHYLSREDYFSMTTIHWILSAVTVLGLSGGSIGLLWILRPAPRMYAALVLLVGGYLVGNKPFYFFYEQFERPALEAQGADFHDGVRYALKDYREWFDQTILTTDHLTPALFFGFIKQYPVDVYQKKQASPLTVVLLIAAALLLIYLILDWKKSGWALQLSSPQWLLVLPFFLTFLVMFPSWRLTSVYSIRYLGGFIVGAYVTVFFILNSMLGQEKAERMLMGMTGFLVVLAVFDNTITLQSD